MNIDALANRLAVLGLALADAQLAAARQAVGLGATACAALVALGVAPGSTIAQLAAVAGVTHSVMVRTVEALRSDGLVDRVADADGRKVALVLTDAGAERRVAILSARAEAMSAALDVLSPSDRATFSRVLDAMLVALTTDRVQADHLCRLCDEDVCGADCPIERRACALEARA
jgi:DNA-binding MarR family transcriptional regulator